MKLKVNDIYLDPIRVGDRLEFRFNAPEDLQYVTIEKDDFIGDLELSEIQLEQSTLSTTFVEPMESETVASGIFKSVQGISYEITDPNSDTWAEIIKTSEASIQTYHSGTLQSTLAQTAEDLVFGVRDIVSGDQSSFNLRLDGIETQVKNEMFNSVRTHLADFIGVEISDLEGNYNAIQDTVGGHIQKIGDLEGNYSAVKQTVDSHVLEIRDIKGNYNTVIDTVNAHTRTIGNSGGNLAQMVMSDLLFQLNVIDEIEDAKSSYTQMADMIGLRASGNSVTIGGDGIIIDAKSIYLGDSTQIKDGIITNRMIASNASIDGAKIKNATIASAKIANLDANKITTGTLQGVEIIAKTGNIGDWILSGGVIHSPLQNSGYTSLKATGDVALATGTPNPFGTTGATLQIWHDGTLRFGELGTRIYSTIRDNLRIMSHSRIVLMANATVESDSRIIPMTNGNLDLGATDRRWQRVRAKYSEDVSSDARHKKNIQEIPQELLHIIAEEVKPKEYEMDGMLHYGYIAQDVERALFKYSYSQTQSLEKANKLIKRFDFLIKDESYLSLVYTEIAVIKEAEIQSRIDKLENKLEELLNAN